MPYDADLSFIFRMPTKIVFGAGSSGEVGMEMENLGCSKALIVTDKVLRENTDIVNRIQNALGDRCAGIFDGVEPDTGVDIVEDGAETGKDLGVDCLVSVGGGSSIDTAKGMAILIKEGGRLRDYDGLNNLTRPPTPHIVIPTTAGTGSEVTYAAVIMDRENHVKLLFVDYHLIPNVGILDPELTVNLPRELTAATGMDAFCHTIEATHSLQAEPIADALAMHAVRLIYEYLPRCVQDGSDLVARGQMLIAACMAGAAFTNAQVGVVHALVHSVGAISRVPHGVANSILLPPCMEFNLDACPDRYAMVARSMGLISTAQEIDDYQAGEKAINAISDLTKSIGMPQRLSEVGVREEDLEAIANLALQDGSIVYNVKFAADPDELLKVLKKVF